MKLDRLLAITMILLNQPRVSATELAARFEVSLRTIYRDMDAINQAGIPIVSFAGSDGGYEIMSGYRIDKQVLSLEDFSSICTALRGARSATDNTDINDLLDRIGALMPAPGSLISVSSGLVDLDFQPEPMVKEKITPIQQAIKTQHLIRFQYLNNKGEESGRTIEPMGLFLKGYVWYLYGYCLTRSDIRVFRLTRMTELQSLPQTFLRRPYTLQDVEQQFMSQANFKKIRAVLHFKPEVKTRVRDEYGFDQVHTHSDGTVSVTTHYSSMDKAMQNILSFSSSVTVVEPTEVIEELKRHIADMAEKYGL